MTLLVAIDPGETTGWTLFDGRRLTRCGVAVGSPPTLPDDVLAKRGPFRGVIEKPQAYPHSPVDVNDLVTLAVTAGEWKQYLHDLGADVKLVYPRTWKGTVPKSVHHRRILSRLTAEELAVMPKRPRAKSYDPNMLDAVGLGLWELGRTRR